MAVKKTDHLIIALATTIIITFICVCAMLAIVNKREKENPPLIPTQPINTQPLSAPCSCAADAYNCEDFPTQLAAQTCYNACNQKGDIHFLDSDLDGRACETLP